MSCSRNFLNGGCIGGYIGSVIGPITGDTRNLDYSSYRGYIGIIKGSGFGV